MLPNAAALVFQAFPDLCVPANKLIDLGMSREFLWKLLGKLAEKLQVLAHLVAMHIHQAYSIFS